MRTKSFRIPIPFAEPTPEEVERGVAELRALGDRVTEVPFIVDDVPPTIPTEVQKLYNLNAGMLKTPILEEVLNQAGLPVEVK